MSFEIARAKPFMLDAIAKFGSRLRSPRRWHLSLRHVWEGAALIWRAISQLILAIVSATVLVVIIAILIKSLTGQTIAIEPLSVPKALAENGYTPDVASQRLRDALSTFAANAHTSMQTPEIALRREDPNIVVPTVGISLDTIASSLRTFLRSARRQNISGEFTASGGHLWLRLRLNGSEFYSTDKAADLDNPDELLALAAPYVFQKVQPYILASSQYETDPMQALETTKQIIANLPSSDENVVRSYVLAGIIYTDQKNFTEAIQALTRAIELSPTNALAYSNLGAVLRKQGNVSESIVKYRKAIELDPLLALAHTNLGAALEHQGNYGEALAEYRKAMEVDPKSAVAHYNLGVSMYDRSDHDGGIAEFRKAVELDSKLGEAHSNLGWALYLRGDRDEGIVEIRKAIEVKPKLSIAHTNLGSALHDQDRFNDAIDEYQKAIQLDPDDVRARENLATALRGEKRRQ